MSSTYWSFPSPTNWRMARKYASRTGLRAISRIRCSRSGMTLIRPSFLKVLGSTMWAVPSQLLATYSTGRVPVAAAEASAAVAAAGATAARAARTTPRRRARPAPLDGLPVPCGIESLPLRGTPFQSLFHNCLRVCHAFAIPSPADGGLPQAKLPKRRLRVNRERRRTGSGLGALLQPLDRPAEQKVADAVLGRPADALAQQAERAVEADLQAVGRTRPAVAKLLEAPRALERLEVAPLPPPVDPVGLAVREAQVHLELGDRRVELGLDERRPPVAPAFERAGGLHRPLPLRRPLDVGGDLEAALDRRRDLDRLGALEVRHPISLPGGGAPYARPRVSPRLTVARASRAGSPAACSPRSGRSPRTARRRVATGARARRRWPPARGPPAARRGGRSRPRGAHAG